MAKKSRIERNNRILKTIHKDAKKRSVLTVTWKSQSSSHDEKFASMIAIQKMPRDGSSTRYRNRCAITGRSRGYHSMFGLCRNVIRHYASCGQISGLKKSSW